MDRNLGPFEVWLSPAASHEENAVMINGLQTIVSQLEKLVSNSIFCIDNLKDIISL